ncbi:gamma carbonic anhydrase family protein [Ruminococcaceae bacterium OttesenSCG-928-I18]|nr:gamma carbonic anhydrase family protein [Ruminococcaceae bacterium OttesenSCG-928-I18]
MKQPNLSPSARVLEGAVVIGDVTLGEECGVWPNCVLRADIGSITVGARTNIQDGSIFHTDEGDTLSLGDDVTVGHLCILHGCTVESGTLIGMGSILMNGVKVGKNCLIGAGSLLTEGTEVPDGHLAFGRPAKVKRALTEEEMRENITHARHYADLLKTYD